MNRLARQVNDAVRFRSFCGSMPTACCGSTRPPRKVRFSRLDCQVLTKVESGNLSDTSIPTYYGPQRRSMVKLDERSRTATTDAQTSISGDGNQWRKGLCALICASNRRCCTDGRDFGAFDGNSGSALLLRRHSASRMRTHGCGSTQRLSCLVNRAISDLGYRTIQGTVFSL